MRINHALEVANILRHNLVQGVRESGQEDANWGRFLLQFRFQMAIVGSRMIADICGRTPHSRSD